MLQQGLKAKSLSAQFIQREEVWNGKPNHVWMQVWCHCRISYQFFPRLNKPFCTQIPHSRGNDMSKRVQSFLSLVLYSIHHTRSQTTFQNQKKSSDNVHLMFYLCLISLQSCFFPQWRLLSSILEYILKALGCIYINWQLLNSKWLFIH